MDSLGRAFSYTFNNRGGLLHWLLLTPLFIVASVVTLFLQWQVIAVVAKSESIGPKEFFIVSLPEHAVGAVVWVVVTYFLVHATAVFFGRTEFPRMGELFTWRDFASTGRALVVAAINFTAAYIPMLVAHMNTVESGYEGLIALRSMPIIVGTAMVVSFVIAALLLPSYCAALTGMGIAESYRANIQLAKVSPASIFIVFTAKAIESVTHMFIVTAAWGTVFSRATIHGLFEEAGIVIPAGKQ